MHDERITFLRRLGITDAQARAYVALSALPHGTAREVSERAATPRTQVYALLDALVDVGLAERDGDAYRARPLEPILRERAQSFVARRARLVDEGEALAAAFTPRAPQEDEGGVRLLRGPSRPAEVLTEWLSEARTSIHAAFSHATLADTLSTPGLADAFTDAVTRVRDARVVLHAPGPAGHIGGVPPRLAPFTRIAPLAAWYLDRFAIDGRRLLLRLSLGASAGDARTPYVAVATTHAGLVADAQALVQATWDAAHPPREVVLEEAPDAEGAFS